MLDTSVSYMPPQPSSKQTCMRGHFKCRWRQGELFLFRHLTIGWELFVGPFPRPSHCKRGWRQRELCIHVGDRLGQKLFASLPHYQRFLFISRQGRHTVLAMVVSCLGVSWKALSQQWSPHRSKYMCILSMHSTGEGKCFITWLAILPTCACTYSVHKFTNSVWKDIQKNLVKPTFSIKCIVSISCG